MLEKTLELSGIRLDWAVAIAEGLEPSLVKVNNNVMVAVKSEFGSGVGLNVYSPTVMPQISWFIITKNKINLDFNVNDDEVLPVTAVMYYKTIDDDFHKVWAIGENALEASLRCFVFAKIGEEIEIPDEWDFID